LSALNIANQLIKRSCNDRNHFLDLEHLKEQINKSGRTPLARLRGLSSALKKWNQDRIANSSTLARSDLSQAEIDTLKQLVQIETSKLKNKEADVVAEQILFLMIGAIKLQSHNDANNMWEMVDKGINAFIQPPRSLSSSINLISISLLMITIVAISVNLALRKEIKSKVYSEEIYADDDRNATVNNLVGLYNEMKKGSCQLPQAAMLQEKERETFITFINDGVVNIESAEDLKNALAHVNCLYPQKLMDKPLN
jgi:hypothetical protein